VLRSPEDRHEPYRDYKNLNKGEQKDYWIWLHQHPDSDRHQWPSGLGPRIDILASRVIIVTSLMEGRSMTGACICCCHNRAPKCGVNAR